MQSRLSQRLFQAVIASLLLATPAVFGQFPDLTITDIDIDPPNPSPGQQIFVDVTAENIGNELPFEEVVVYLYHDSLEPPAACAFDQMQPLEILFPSGSERHFQFTLQYPTVGVHRLWAWIDGCEPQIDEWSDENNWLSRDVAVGLGDLQILGISPSVPDPVPGQEFNLIVSVANVGPALIDTVYWVGVRFGAQEPIMCIFDYEDGPFLGPGANSVTNVLLGPVVFEAQGTFPVWGWVDCIDNVVEADETNNKLLSSLVIGRADLIVDSVTPSVATPSVNQPFNVDVVVRNAGSREAVSFEAALVIDQLGDPGQACPAGRQYVPLLEAGGSTTLTFSVTLSESRAYRIWGVADACDALEEAREENNTRSLDVNVGNNTVAAPDLVVESIRVFEIPTLEWGAVTTFDVTVRNVGIVTSAACRVGDFGLDFPGVFPSYVVIGSPGPTSGGQRAVGSNWNDCSWRSRDVPGLAPGASATVQFWRYYSQSGPQSFSASVDVCGEPPYRNVFEASEENNTLTVQFEVAACPADADNDGVCDDADHCPGAFDPLNSDSDNDGAGDACDNDDDNDGADDAADCAPRNPFIHPRAAEDCIDGLDNNCEGQIDEGATTLYRDADGDGFGDAAVTVIDCARAGYVANAADCDDANAARYPGANGRCDDGLDNDCDGTIDNEHTRWGLDADGDGFANPNDVILDDDGVCDGQPAGRILPGPPDPDDADFFDPKPVRAVPETILFSVAQHTQPPPQVLALLRDGPEPYTYAISVTYQPDSEGFGPTPWLLLDPPSGVASGGRAEIQLSVQLPTFRASYPATLHVALNGQPAFDVPAVLEVRQPRLTIRHAGQGGGLVFAGSRIDLEPPFEQLVPAVDTAQGLFESVVDSSGFSLSLAAITEGDCSNLQGVYDESGAPLPIDRFYKLDADRNIILDEQGFPDLEASGPGVSTVSFVDIEMDRDREVTVHYVLSGNACTACGFGGLGFLGAAHFITRRKSRARRQTRRQMN